MTRGGWRVCASLGHDEVMRRFRWDDFVVSLRTGVSFMYRAGWGQVTYLETEQEFRCVVGSYLSLSSYPSIHPSSREGAQWA